jgi:hypothetical protein
MSQLATTARARSAIWWAVLGVAACGVVATAHGLFEVTLGCGVPVVVAALYVPITDGLALVAYAATDRLRSWSRAYAWLVVLVAAGLSGTAQAVYLGGLGAPPVQLRYGVGAWPAVAVAVAAHLLWLVGRPAHDARVAPVASPVEPTIPAALTEELAQLRESIPAPLDRATLDSLRQGVLSEVQAMLDRASEARPKARPTRTRGKVVVPPGKARSAEWTEAVGLLRASGVIKQTAYNRANAAERDGRLAELIADLRTPRSVQVADSA